MDESTENINSGSETGSDKKNFLPAGHSLKNRLNLKHPHFGDLSPWLSGLPVWIKYSLFVIAVIVADLLIYVMDWCARNIHILLNDITGGHFWRVALLLPFGLAAIVFITIKAFPGAQSSGVSQAIAATHMGDWKRIEKFMSLRITVGRYLMTLCSFATGASFGPEGPAIQVGCGILFKTARNLFPHRRDLQRVSIIAGGALGIGAAFNAPFGGILFGLEEMARQFNIRAVYWSLFTCTVGGMTTLMVAGYFSYFGTVSALIPTGMNVTEIIVCGILTGVAGGIFNRLLIVGANDFPKFMRRFIIRRPVGVAFACGVVLVLIYAASGGTVFGPGVVEAVAVLHGTATMPWLYAPLKLLATAVSSFSGAPGGLFMPTLAVGAGLGQLVSYLYNPANMHAIAIISVGAYLGAVIRAPLTAAVITAELVGNVEILLPILAATFIADFISDKICAKGSFHIMADRYSAAAAVAPVTSETKTAETEKPAS